MAFSLSIPGGWYDIPDSLWTAGNAAIEDHLVSLNALIRFAAVADEYIQAAPVRNGDTVALAASSDDGYNYSRAEAMYAFAMQASPNPVSGTNSGGGNIMFVVDGVDQDTGVANSFVDYYVQGGQETGSNDGLLSILLCCRRGAGNRTASVSVASGVTPPPIVISPGGGPVGGGPGSPGGGGVAGGTGGGAAGGGASDYRNVSGGGEGFQLGGGFLKPTGVRIPGIPSSPGGFK